MPPKADAIFHVYIHLGQWHLQFRIPTAAHDRRRVGRSVRVAAEFLNIDTYFLNIETPGFYSGMCTGRSKTKKTGFRSFFALFVLLCFCVPRRAKICRWRLSLVVFQYNPGSGGVHPPPGRPAGRVGRSGLVSAMASAAGLGRN